MNLIPTPRTDAEICKYPAAQFNPPEEARFEGKLIVAADFARTLESELTVAKAVLRKLYDLQNGCPLPKYQHDWDAAMKQAHDILT